jgi:hypothetical protein
MFLADLRCCIDNNRGDHIHHLDGNPSNNNIDNLVLLCFDCHDNATVKNGLRKRLSAKTILKYRNYHYEKIKTERSQSLKKIDSKINIISYEDIVNATMTSIVLFEISKLKDEYHECAKMDRDYILKKFLKFVRYNNVRISYEIFSFLKFVAYETRSGLPSKMIFTIFSLVESYFPINQEDIKKTQINEIAKSIISIATTIIYDSAIYTNNFSAMRYGYLILKSIYLHANKTSNKTVLKEVSNAFEEIKNHLNRPERTDLGNAKTIHEIFKKDLQTKTLVAPIIPDEIYKLIKIEDNKRFD